MLAHFVHKYTRRREREREREEEAEEREEKKKGEKRPSHQFGSDVKKETSDGEWRLRWQRTTTTTTPRRKEGRQEEERKIHSATQVPAPCQQPT